MTSAVPAGGVDALAHPLRRADEVGRVARRRTRSRGCAGSSTSSSRSGSGHGYPSTVGRRRICPAVALRHGPARSYPRARALPGGDGSARRGGRDPAPVVADDADVQAFAARLGGSVPPVARCSEPLLPLLAAALWSVRARARRARGLVRARGRRRPGPRARRGRRLVPARRRAVGVPAVARRGLRLGARPGAAPRRRALPRPRPRSPAAASSPSRRTPWPSACRRPTGGRGPSPWRSGDEIERDDLLEQLVEAGYERVDARRRPRPGRGARRHRRRLPDDRPDAAARRAVRRRGRAPLDLLGLHPALARGARARRGLPGRRAPRGRGRPRGLDREDGERQPVPRGLVPLLPELIAGGGLVAWEPDRVSEEAEEHVAEVAEHLPVRASAAAPTCGSPTSSSWSAARRALDPLAPRAGVTSRRSAPRSPVAAWPRPRTSCAASSPPDCACVVAFPHRGDAERALLGPAPRRGPDPRRRASRCPPSPACSSRLAGRAAASSRATSASGAAPLDAGLPPRAPTGGETCRSGSAAPWRAFADLRPGDYVVHEDHGVGRFVRFDTKTVAGVTRDYVELQFRGEDQLFVPHEQIGKVARYIGADGRAPTLSKLGGKAWQTLKSRARVARARAGRRAARALRRRARPATRAAARRRRRLDGAARGRLPLRRDRGPGARHRRRSRPTSTPQRPMDRLICGDVGFGKTEVALRAAFKVATAGRQVLMLVPTTVLAQQHGQTFRDRFRDFPLRVETGLAPALARPTPRPRSRTSRRARSTSSSARTGCSRATSCPRNLGLVLRRRGAALRRGAEGAAAPAAPRGRRALALGHADPAHAAHVARGPARHLGDRRRRRAAAARSARTSASGTRSSWRTPSGASTSAAGSSSSCTTASRRSTRPPRSCARSCPRCASASGTARWPSASSRRS